MYRKKEFLLTGIGLFIFLVIGIISCQRKPTELEKQLEVSSNEIIIRIEGEVVRPATLYFYQTTNYGVVLSKIKYLYNKYSDLKDFDLKEQIHKSMTIVIPTLDINNHYNEESKIQINSATQSELMSLYLIGEKRSEKILDYRIKNGKFKSWEEFWEVASVKNEEAQKRIKKQAIL